MPAVAPASLAEFPLLTAPTTVPAPARVARVVRVARVAHVARVPDVRAAPTIPVTYAARTAVAPADPATGRTAVAPADPATGRTAVAPADPATGRESVATPAAGERALSAADAPESDPAPAPEVVVSNVSDMIRDLTISGEFNNMFDPTRISPLKRMLSTLAFATCREKVERLSWLIGSGTPAEIQAAAADLSASITALRTKHHTACVRQLYPAVHYELEQLHDDVAMLFATYLRDWPILLLLIGGAWEVGTFLQHNRAAVIGFSVEVPSVDIVRVNFHGDADSLAAMRAEWTRVAREHATASVSVHEPATAPEDLVAANISEPVAPEPVAPVPVAEPVTAPITEPVAPVPVAEPVAQVPVAPVPVAQVPVAQVPVAQVPVAQVPVAPVPVAEPVAEPVAAARRLYAEAVAAQPDVHAAQAVPAARAAQAVPAARAAQAVQAVPAARVAQAVPAARAVPAADIHLEALPTDLTALLEHLEVAAATPVSDVGRAFATAVRAIRALTGDRDKIAAAYALGYAATGRASSADATRGAWTEVAKAALAGELDAPGGKYFRYLLSWLRVNVEISVRFGHRLRTSPDKFREAATARSTDLNKFGDANRIPPTRSQWVAADRPAAIHINFGAAK